MNIITNQNPLLINDVVVYGISPFLPTRDLISLMGVNSILNRNISSNKLIIIRIQRFCKRQLSKLVKQAEAMNKYYRNALPKPLDLLDFLIENRRLNIRVQVLTVTGQPANKMIKLGSRLQKVEQERNELYLLRKKKEEAIIPLSSYLKARIALDRARGWDLMPPGSE